jgi:hypothetical protein
VLCNSGPQNKKNEWKLSGRAVVVEMRWEVVCRYQHGGEKKREMGE